MDEEVHWVGRDEDGKWRNRENEHGNKEEERKVEEKNSI